ncbi:MAG: hypothetical protein H6670_01940 [Anaerolineaceae bacterium]|nr:hypothetical protein [Anaerolineaceae bacterium]
MATRYTRRRKVHDHTGALKDHSEDKMVHRVGLVMYVEDCQCPKCNAEKMLIFGLQHSLLQICPHCQTVIERECIIDEYQTPQFVVSNHIQTWADGLDTLAKYNITLDMTGRPILIDDPADQF